MMYFTYLCSNNQPANSLQRQALAVLQAESNLLINNADAFIETLRKQIVKLNELNPRCKSLDLYTFHFDRESSIGISLGSHFTVNFRLYPVKNGAAKAKEAA